MTAVIRGVLLGTVEEQVAGGDRNPVDPAGCSDTEDIPVLVNFDRAHPIGRARVFHEDGRLVCEATLEIGAEVALDLGRVLAFGGRRDAVSSVSLVRENTREDQPPWSLRP